MSISDDAKAMFQLLADSAGTYIDQHPTTGEDQWVLLLSEDGGGFSLVKKTWAALSELCESAHLPARLARLLAELKGGVGIVVLASGQADAFVLLPKKDEMTRDDAVGLLARKLTAIGGLPTLDTDEFWLFDAKKVGCGWDYDLRRCHPSLLTTAMRQAEAALRTESQRLGQAPGQVVFLLIEDGESTITDVVWIEPGGQPTVQEPGNGPSPGAAPAASREDGE